MGKKTFLFGALTGAAGMYLLDPVSGNERRRQTADRAQEIADSPAAQKLADQALEATRGLHDDGPDADGPLADKVSATTV